MKRLVFLALLAFLAFASGCAPSDSMVQTAIAQTAVANIEAATDTPEPAATRTPRPTRTITATVTFQPTRTPKPTMTSTATMTNEDAAETLKGGIEAMIEIMLADDIETINLIRFNDNELQIELKNRWSSRDMQPDISYKAIQWISTFTTRWEEGDSSWRRAFPDGFSVDLQTYSATGGYPYHSYTTFQTLRDVNEKKISYQEWVEAAQAGFK